MRHEPFNARLHELLDCRERAEDDDELRALAELSPECRDVLAAQQRLFEGLDADEVPELPADFARRVVTEAVRLPEAATADNTLISSARLNSTRWRGAWVLELAAVAALVLVSIGGWSLIAPPAGSGSGVANLPQESALKQPKLENVAQSRPVDDEPQVTKDNAIAVAEPPTGDEDAHQRYDELYQAILQRLPDQAGREDLLARRPQWVDEVALGLRPVATSFGGAINTLRSTLPSSDKSDRPDKPQAGMFDGSPMSGIA